MASVTMPGPVRGLGRAAGVDRRLVARWYVAALLVGFAVPFVGVDVLGLHHDLYLLVYFTVVGAFLAAFVAHVGLAGRAGAEWLRARLWWSGAAGALVAVALVRNVMGEASMPHPSGAYFWFEIAWRGVLYGVVDALLLFVFPAAIAYLLLRSGGRRHRLRLGLLTLGLSMGITATYHLGYPQFRDADVAQPEVGAVIANVPAVLTGNPAGSLLAHASFHVAANVHTYRSEIFLPPELDGDTARGSGAAGIALGATWIAVAGSVLYRHRERLFPTKDA